MTVTLHIFASEHAIKAMENSPLLYRGLSKN